MTYRIGKPLEEGQSPLHMFRPKPGMVTIAVYRPDGIEAVNVTISEEPKLSDEDWHARVVFPALAALNKRIAGWPIGPFTVEDVRAAA